MKMPLACSMTARDSRPACRFRLRGSPRGRRTSRDEQSARRYDVGQYRDQAELTEPAPGYRGPSDESRAAQIQTPGRAADVMNLIMADHRRIRRLRETLHDAARLAGGSGPDWVPGHGQRLTDLLVAHFEAEEKICCLPVLRIAPDTAGPRREALADHDDIREAIREASLQRPGSAPWRRTVTDTLAGSMHHLRREENGILADRPPALTPGQRRLLGRQWSERTAPAKNEGGVMPTSRRYG